MPDGHIRRDVRPAFPMIYRYYPLQGGLPLAGTRNPIDTPYRERVACHGNAIRRALLKSGTNAIGVFLGNGMYQLQAAAARTSAAARNNSVRRYGCTYIEGGYIYSSRMIALEYSEHSPNYTWVSQPWPYLPIWCSTSRGRALAAAAEQLLTVQASHCEHLGVGSKYP